MSEEKKKSSGQDEIVVNLDSFAVPAAIVVAGLIIAGAIFFTNKNSENPTVAGTGDTNAAAAPEEQFPEAQTTVDDDPYIGNRDTAKVAIVEFNDFLCSYCQRHAQDTYPEIVEKYVDSGDVIYVYRDFPLEMHGQLALDIANASECISELAGNEKFAEFHNNVFMVESTEALKEFARDTGVDMGSYDTCMSENRYASEVQKDLADGQEAGVQGTPGFVVGILEADGSVKGKLIAGAYPFESFAEVIDEMLAQ